MRAIAAQAEVAPGAIYYHFPSKESIVQEYYKRTHFEHIEKIREPLLKETLFAKRIALVLTSKLEQSQPFKNMAIALFQSAANPESEVSPFSEKSKELRIASLQVFKEVVDGSKDKFNSQIKDILPEYLWLYQMGIILFWIFDRSENSKRSFQLIEQTAPLLSMLNDQLNSPFAIPFKSKIITLLKKFKPNLG